MAGQRAIESVAFGRRTTELETEIQSLKETIALRARESATTQQQFREKLIGDLNAKLQTYREELARYFETEQNAAEARILDIRERQNALKN